MARCTSTCVARDAEHCANGDEDWVCQHYSDVHQDVECCKMREVHRMKGLAHQSLKIQEPILLLNVLSQGSAPLFNFLILVMGA